MKKILQPIREYAGHISWPLLLFLVLFLDVKLFIKAGALLLFIFINRKFFLARRWYNQAFTWFYISLLCISFINLLLNAGDITQPYLFTFCAGILFWLMNLAAAVLACRYSSSLQAKQLHNTISLFFIINAAVTFVTLLIIILDSGAINPYTYQGMYQKYFIGTGDRMRGITFDVSTTNAFINAFGIIYFVRRTKAVYALCCMFALLLTASNITNILLTAVLLFMFAFKSTRVQKSLIVIFFLALVTFMARISPQNNHYAFHLITERFGAGSNPLKQAAWRPGDNNPPATLLAKEESKRQYAQLYVDSIKKLQVSLYSADIKQPVLTQKPTLPRADIHSAPYQRIKDTTALQKKLLEFAQKNITGFDTSPGSVLKRKYPGKLIAMNDATRFLMSHPARIITGNGVANYSSKLAFRATGFGVSGGYPERFVYINDSFKNHHLHLFLSYYTKDKVHHSVINTPNSVYTQLISEYGLAGVLAFLILYVFYFIKKINRAGYGLPLMMMMLAGFAIEYWFEFLSITVLFELMMLADTSQGNLTNMHREEHVA